MRLVRGMRERKKFTSACTPASATDVAAGAVVAAGTALLAALRPAASPSAPAPAAPGRFDTSISSLCLSSSDASELVARKSSSSHRRTSSPRTMEHSSKGKASFRLLPASPLEVVHSGERALLSRSLQQESVPSRTHSGAAPCSPCTIRDRRVALCASDSTTGSPPLPLSLSSALSAVAISAASWSSCCGVSECPIDAQSSSPLRALSLLELPLAMTRSFSAVV
ncbi:hypothetical protein B484DRAFT_449456, partial [Ochromonadaceae sp. CCMP2298]